MPYGLGIDLGTSCTIAAITRTLGASTGPEVLALGVDAPGIPTVLHVADDGTVLVGPAAEPLVLSDPDRVFRGFLHQVGEPSVSEPSPVSLTARLVRWVVDAVSDREGLPPERITLAHPAVWGPDECRTVHAALNEVGLPGTLLVPVPVAVAAASATTCEVGETVAVYDLGATFCASVARWEGAGFVLLGEPQVIEDGGGARFDELVLERILDELGKLGNPQIAAPDLEDQVVLAGMAALLADCVAAREALCDRPEVAIPVSLPGLRAEVRLTRDELETLIHPTLRATVATLRGAIAAAGLTPNSVGTVLVAGGCAGIPSVVQLLTAELGRPVTLLADPDLAAVRGAASLTAHIDTAAPFAAQPPRTAPEAAQPAQTSLDKPIEQLPTVREFATTPASPLAKPRHSAGSRSRPQPRVLLVVAAGLLTVAIVALPFTLFGGPDLGAEASKMNYGDPGRGGLAPPYGSAGASFNPPDTDNTDPGSATMPPFSPLLPVARRVEAPLGPQSPPLPAPRLLPPAIDPITGTATPTPGPPTTPPPSTSTTTPPTPTTTTAPPPTTTAPPPTTTAPPSTTTPPPPTTTTAPPPTTTTAPPPTTTTAPPPTTTTAPHEPLG
ncbi:MAG: Hsp70 family protein [Pseudonocardiaceae bacterium]